MLLLSDVEEGNNQMLTRLTPTLSVSGGFSC